MLSRKDRLQIENICYANVLGRFSFFHNPKYRGPKFSWDWWIEDCVASTDDWMCTHYKHVGLEALELAEKFTRSIAASSVLKMKE